MLWKFCELFKENRRRPKNQKKIPSPPGNIIKEKKHNNRTQKKIWKKINTFTRRRSKCADKKQKQKKHKERKNIYIYIYKLGRKQNEHEKRLKKNDKNVYY
jgi:hypothetical protein